MPASQARRATVEGLVFVAMAVERDDEGWSVEPWNDDGLAALGLGGFHPAGQTARHFEHRGTTTAFRAEPEHRLIQVLAGEAFGAWVDLRPGPAFGVVEMASLGLGSAVLVPAGVGQAIQVIAPGTTVVTLHGQRRLEAQETTAVDAFDHALAIPWPIPRHDARVPDTDAQSGPLTPPSPIARRAAGAPAPVGGPGEGQPFRVLFVCTGNICRSAYAAVAGEAAAPSGVEFSSAGIRALVGEGIDPPMAERLKGRGDPSAHRARQLTRALVDEADLILTMAAEHRRYILDEWPAMGSKTFVLGQAARTLGQHPGDVPRDGLAEVLRGNRTVKYGDDVRDPYRQGPEAAALAARTIDGHLEVLLATLRSSEG